MIDERKRYFRIVGLLAIAAVFAFLAAIGVVYAKNIVGFFGTIWSAVFPIILGFIVAFLLNLIMSKLETLYFPNSGNRIIAATRRPVCLIASIAFIVLAATAIVNLVLPELKASVGVIEDGAKALYALAVDWAASNPGLTSEVLDASGLSDLNQSLTDLASSSSGSDSSNLTSVMKSVFSTMGSIVSAIVAFVIAVIFSIYALLDKDRVKRGAQAVFEVFIPAKWSAPLRHACDVAYQAFARFITGQCVEAVVIGVLCAIGMTIFGMPYAVSVGVCVGATALIPIFGAWLGGIVGFLMILTVDPMQAVWFVVFLVILQQIESHLIYPNVVGAMVDLPSIWVFTGVIVGGTLFGVLGMFLGVPAISAIRTLVMEHIAAVRARNENGPSRPPLDTPRNEQNAPCE